MAVLVGRARAEKPRGDWGGSKFYFSRGFALVLARFAREFRDYAALAPGSTKPPCYAGYSTTSFNANVVVAKTSYQMLEVLSFCDGESAKPPSVKVTVLTFLVKYDKT